jgi:hypothetical protein
MKRLRSLVSILVLLASGPLAAHGAVSVEGTVVPLGGGVFSYSYSVTNTEAEALSIVSITDSPLGDPLIQATLDAPLGFAAIYDDGLGIVDFIEDSSAFEPFTTVSPFTFQSLSGPASFFTSFEAFTVTGNSISGDVVNRLVPEPSSALFASLGICAFFVFRRRP